MISSAKCAETTSPSFTQSFTGSNSNAFGIHREQTHVFNTE